MVTIEAQVTLIIKKNKTEDIETKVFGEIGPVGRDEFAAAGQKGFKAEMMIKVWDFEYSNQEEIIVDGKRMAIYRTYGPRTDGKMELYAGERVGKQ